MAFRFRTSIKLAPGVRLNFSRSGVSTTLGGRGLNVNVGRRGTRLTAGISGTGITYHAAARGGGGARSGSGGSGGVVSAGGAGEGCLGCGAGAIIMLLMMIGLCASPNPPARMATVADTAVSLSSQSYYAPPEPRETFYLHAAMNLRAGAGKGHARVRTLRRGERVTLGPKDAAGWAPLYDGDGRREGYVYRASDNVRTSAPRAEPPRPRARPTHPAGASAICRDGTYSYSRNRRGTCSHHGGVRAWL